MIIPDKIWEQIPQTHPPGWKIDIRIGSGEGEVKTVSITKDEENKTILVVLT